VDHLLQALLPRSPRLALVGSLLALTVLGLGIHRVRSTPLAIPSLTAQNPPARLAILSLKAGADGWLHREQLLLTASTDALLQHPFINLRGCNSAIQQLGGKLPGVKAALYLPNRPATVIPASLFADGTDYLLLLAAQGCDLPPGQAAEIRLAFDSSFSPREVGLPENSAEVVLPAPYSVAMQSAFEGIPQSFGMKGMDGAWVLHEGFAVTGPTEVLRLRPVICLRGLNLTMDRLGGKLPDVQATLHLPNRGLRVVPASLSADASGYLLTAQVDPADLPNYAVAEIHFTFGSWFVPKELGINDDGRELVLLTPFTLSVHTAQEAQAFLPAAPAAEAEAEEDP
jgi:hypothetical protein